MNEIKVSICCLTYNHEKYIKKALNSFLNQKTNFKYEILIHDDASTDKTAEIIREYEKEYPDLIKPIYQKENQYSKGVAILKKYQFPRASGKYIAMCEGDDYWKDDKKLQKQFDALENNPNCVICTCIVEHIKENGESQHVFQPSKQIVEELKNRVMTSQKMFSDILKKNIIPFQMSSFFMRSSIIDEYVKENPEFSKTKFFGDVPILLYLVAHGDVYFLPEVMSCYREFSIGSWTNTHFQVRERKINHYQEILKMLEKYDVYTKRRFEESLKIIQYKYEFSLYELQGKYSQLLKKKYKSYYREKTLKEKVYILLQVCLQSFGFKNSKRRDNGQY